MYINREEEILHRECSEAQAQAAQRAVCAPSLEVLRAGLDGALSPDLVRGSSAHGRGLDLDEL